VYTTVGFWLLVAGIVLLVLAAFGIEAPIVHLFQLGVAFCFAAFLVR
jgi:hypothetical protein